VQVLVIITDPWPITGTGTYRGQLSVVRHFIDLDRLSRAGLETARQDLDLLGVQRDIRNLLGHIDEDLHAQSGHN
jgi:hypothetical protein